MTDRSSGIAKKQQHETKPLISAYKLCQDQVTNNCYRFKIIQSILSEYQCEYPGKITASSKSMVTFSHPVTWNWIGAVRRDNKHTVAKTYCREVYDNLKFQNSIHFMIFRERERTYQLLHLPTWKVTSSSIVSPMLTGVSPAVFPSSPSTSI